MKKHKILYLTIIIAMLVLCASCTTENNAVDNPANDITYNSAENPNNENEGDNSDNDEISTQIGDLIIITLKGQEPIQNEDGTITLPGGGRYTTIRDAYTIYTVSSGSIINNSGSMNFTDTLNVDSTITIEYPDGRIEVMNRYGIVNGDIIKDSEQQNQETDALPKYTISDETADKFEIIYTFNDGTEMITDDYITFMYYAENESTSSGYYFIVSGDIFTIKLPNRVVIDVPINTKIEIDQNGKLVIIIIGDSSATIKQADETVITISENTVLDKNGNVIENLE